MSDDEETGTPPRAQSGADFGPGTGRQASGAGPGWVEDARPGGIGPGGSGPAGPGAGGIGFEGTGSGGAGSGGTGSGGTGFGSAGSGVGGPGGPQSAGPLGGPNRPPLRRERRSRVIAGVCGGLGRHLDIDPVVFRILFVVLTFFGGLGLLVYAAAWLFIPRDGEQESEAQRLLTGGSALAAIAITVVLVLGFMAMVSTIADGFGHAVPLLVVAAAIVAVIVWRKESREPVAAQQGRPEFAEADFAAPDWASGGQQQRPKPWWQRPVSGYPAPSADTGSISGAEFTGGAAGSGAPRPGGTTESRGSADRGGAGTFGGGSDDGREGALSVAAKPGRRLSGLALSGTLLVLGILGVLAAAGAIRVGWAAGTALTVMAIGAAMMIGGLYGRARWLIPVGLVVAVPLIVVNAFRVPFHGETGDVDWTPASAAAASGSAYDLAAGRGTLDLTAVNPAGGTVHVTAYVGAGRLLVTVPRDVEVQLTAHVGMGQITFVDQTDSGLDVTKTYDAGAIGSSRGTIALDLKAGAGKVEVDRAAG